MKQNSERHPEGSAGRIPLVVVEGRRIVGRTVDRTERYARLHPWTGLGAAACAGMCVGALLGFLIFRD